MRLALSSLAAGAFATAAGAMFAALAALVITLLVSGLGVGETIGGFVLAAPVFMIFSAGSLLYLLPAIAPAAALAGGALWASGETRPRLRQRLPWAAAGALFALAYRLAAGGTAPDAEAMLDFVLPDERLQTAAMVIGGAGAALAFRATMRLLGELLPPPTDGEC